MELSLPPLDSIGAVLGQPSCSQSGTLMVVVGALHFSLGFSSSCFLTSASICVLGHFEHLVTFHHL